MQKWEYLYVEAYGDYVARVNGVPVDAEKMEKKGEPLPEWYNEEIPLFLNRAGRDGWELVSATPFGFSMRNDFSPTYEAIFDSHRLIFKRPVVDSSVEGQESILKLTADG